NWLHPQVRPIRMKLAVGDKETIDENGAVSAIAANVVHSQDAAHMHLTVRAAKLAGIETAMIHDSFGCHARNADKFRKIIRQEFVWMHRHPEHDILAQILDQAKRVLPRDKWAKLPRLPKYGTLDIDGVLDSEYAFA